MEDSSSILSHVWKRKCDLNNEETDVDARIGHKTADSSFFGYKKQILR